MKITREIWDNYITILRKLSDKAAEDMIRRQNTLLNAVQAGEIASSDATRSLVDYAYALATRYGEGTAAAACEMYDSVTRLSGARLKPADPAPTATYGETAKAVYGTMKTMPETVPSAVGRLVKMAGVDTTMKNAIRDGAQWAWIPSGDSCPFCMMLASRGWERASKEMLKGGHAQHIHNNCDCTFAIRHDGKSTVEGYDPDALREQWHAAEGSGTRDKLNFLRREQRKDPLMRERINAQKRAAYAAKHSKARTLHNEKDLKEVSKSSIINMQSNKEITRYFSQKYGILVSGFEERELFDVKAVMAGIDDVIRKMPETEIKSVKFDIRLKDYGILDEYGNIIIGPKGLKSYGTGVHEAAHAFDRITDVSESILKQARRNLRLRKNSREYEKLSYDLTGSLKDARDSKEVFAYAIETEMGKGKGNRLSKEIYRLLEELL